jgi:hypothetical protein
MGTHNLLLRLGEAAYLEVISSNPAADPPGRPRWFGLDEADSAAGPRLSAWVARTHDIRTAVAAAAEDLGPIETMNRGDLEWLITVAPSGIPLLDGVAPALIQWPLGRHPTSGLRDAGCRLVRLEVFHSKPVRVSLLLERLGLPDAVTVTPLPHGVRGYLAALIDTPNGPRGISTPNYQLERL